MLNRTHLVCSPLDGRESYNSPVLLRHSAINSHWRCCARNVLALRNFTGDRRGQHRVVLNGLDERRRTSIKLLYCVVRSQGEECCLWTVARQAPDSVTRWYHFARDVLCSDVPRPCLSTPFCQPRFKKQHEVFDSPLTRQNTARPCHSLTSHTNVTPAQRYHSSSVCVWSSAFRPLVALQRSRLEGPHPRFETPTCPTSA